MADFVGVNRRMTTGHSGWMALSAAPHPRDLTDEQWDFIGPCLPELTRRKDGRERPWREKSALLNGILWILRTGAPWADLPNRYPSYQTCHRRFQQWVRSGVLRSVLEVLAQALHDEGDLDLQEAFIDGSFAPAKQGGARVGKTKRGKGSKIMAIADRQGLPVAVTSRAPRRMKSHWCTPRSLSGLSGSYRSVSSAITPTSRTDWMRNWHAVAWS
jgi:transposase